MEAKTKYKEKQTQIKEELVLLKGKLSNHKKAFNKHTTNWGYVGDLDHLLRKLKDLNQFLNG